MTTKIKALDQAEEHTVAWVDETAQHLGAASRETAYAALRSVLPVLRDRLTVDEGAQLSAQLPTVLRGLFYEAWDPSRKAWKERHAAFFLEYVGKNFGTKDYTADDAVRAVFATLSDRISAGEIRDVRAIMPAELKELWPAWTAIG